MAENPNPNPNPVPNPTPRTFTQAELDEILGRRLAEERKKFPTEAEMAAFREYQSNQQTTEQKLTAERDTAQAALTSANAEVERLKHERILLGKGVAEDDLEYYDFKIKKAAESAGKTYEAAAEEFIQSRQQTPKFDTGGNLGGGKSAPKSTNAMMNDLLRKAAKR